jgi:hypothetical protein
MLNNLRNIVMGWMYPPPLPPQIVINNIIYLLSGKLECFENKLLLKKPHCNLW